MRSHPAYISSQPYVDYYLNQARGLTQGGGSLPYFAGRSVQRGHGIGSFFSSLFSKIRGALPGFFRSVGKIALKGAVDFGSDILEKKRKPLEALKEHGLTALKTVAADTAPKIIQGIKDTISAEQKPPPKDIKDPDIEESKQTGSGKRKRRHKQIKRLKKVCNRDIFYE